MSTLLLFPTAPMEWAAIALAYLVGAIPFGLILGRLLKGVDIREAGSRNIGATNAGRVLGRPFGLAAFLGDFGKGWVATFGFGTWLAASSESAPLLVVLCGAAAVLGHVFPIYLGFRGGKAVATGCGAIVGIDPVVCLGGALAWVLVLLVTRYVGLASMVMGVSFPLLAWWRSGGRDYGLEAVLGMSALTLLILLRHRANISRMLAGTEPKLGQSSPPREEPENV